MKKFFYIFILLAFSRVIFGQIDTTKRYIENLIIKSDIKFSDISVSFQNKTSKINFDNDSIQNIAFYKNDNVTLKIRLDKFEFELKEFESYFHYCDFTHQVKIIIDKQKIFCTQIIVNDGSGNEYGYTLNCPEKLDRTTPQNYVDIWTFGKINPDPKAYQTLWH
jgi:hypothetical protein